METKKWTFEELTGSLSKFMDASFKIIESEYPHTPVCKLPVAYGGKVDENGINQRNLNNAKLIAAAPALYEGLKALMNQYHLLPESTSDGMKLYSLIFSQDDLNKAFDAINEVEK